MGRLAEKPKYYWDACAWIALIQQEPGRFDDLSYIVNEARAGKVEIWTSNFTLAEVFKRPCDGEQKSLSIVDDTAFENFILQDVVTRAQVDFSVGSLARRLLRSYPTISKPQDAIHLATALLYDVDELHTFDRTNLTGLSGKIPRKDGQKLKICAPPKRPALPPRPADLFSPQEMPDGPIKTETPEAKDGKDAAAGQG
jgi:predicted nucleic acid-binding protein